MKTPKHRLIIFLEGLKNLFGVGIYLLLVGILLEVLTLVVHQRLSFPISIPRGIQILLTLLLILGCMFGIIWFNKTLNLVKIHMAGGKNKLMTYGPFNYVRHPLYATMLISLPAIMIIWFLDLLFIVPWVLIFITAYYMILAEERGLVRMFGELYKKYQEFVPMLLPYKGSGGVRFRKYCDNVKLNNEPLSVH